eukprot:COSAG05_NODE_305_length_11703_cov_15.056705_12_plen_249_part_00
MKLLLLGLLAVCAAVRAGAEDSGIEDSEIEDSDVVDAEDSGSAAESSHAAAPMLQAAFVFCKPHAMTEAVHQLARDKFAEVGVAVIGEGEITGDAIDKKQHIDRHYYAIASKATLLKPSQLNVPAEKFKAEFGEEWSTVLEENRAFNAVDAAKVLGRTPEELNSMWDATKNNGRVKLAGGFYCALIDKERKIYTFNAFFMSMRKRYTEPGAAIRYFWVEFDATKLSWADFRGKVYTPTLSLSPAHSAS